MKIHNGIRVQQVGQLALGKVGGGNVQRDRLRAARRKVHETLKNIAASRRGAAVRRAAYQVALDKNITPLREKRRDAGNDVLPDRRDQVAADAAARAPPLGRAGGHKDGVLDQPLRLHGRGKRLETRGADEIVKLARCAAQVALGRGKERLGR